LAEISAEGRPFSDVKKNTWKWEVVSEEPSRKKNTLDNHKKIYLPKKIDGSQHI